MTLSMSSLSFSSSDVQIEISGNKVPSSFSRDTAELGEGNRVLVGANKTVRS